MRIFTGLAATAVLAVLTLPTDLDSCSIAPPEPVFATTERPAATAAEFRAGEIGVIQPTFRRRYLVAAYRTLTGAPVSEKEAAWMLPSASTATTDSAAPAKSPDEAWAEARKGVAGLAAAAYIDSYKSAKSGGEVVYFRNCMDAAFDTARQTLAARIAKWGATSANVRDWTAAQDTVFSNCSGEKVAIPAPAPAGADPLLAADRRYQIAAAYFYACDWRKAREAFTAIAAERDSPWRNIAPYLIARTYVREASLDVKPAALAEAESRFQAIANDRARPELREASLRMVDYVRTRRDPAKRIAELGAALGQASKTDEQTLTDYTYLLARLPGGDGKDWKPAGAGDMADWIQAFESSSPSAGAYAARRWKESRSPAWLIAALALPSEPGVTAELVQAARAIRPGSPALDSAAYFGIQAEIRAHHPDAARGWADQMLARKLSNSTRNRMLALRMATARDTAEFLKFAPRTPEARLQSFDGHEEDIEAPPVPTGVAPILDDDAMEAFNHQAPLALWVEAASSASLPSHVQLRVARAGFVRATVLNRGVEAKQLLQRVVQLDPKAADLAKDYLAAAGPDAARFAALMIVLRDYRFDPFLSQVLKDSEPENPGGRGEWGFSPAEKSDDAAKLPPTYLSPAQRAAAEAEQKQLEETAPAAATYLAAQMVAFAQAHPDDPRVPESLYRAVRATRFGSKDDNTGKYSRQAFDILHRRFPKSEWTAKTPYWRQ